MLDNTGLFVTDDLNNIVDPVVNATFVFLTTDGQLYAFNGSGYDQISGGGAGSGITQLTGDVTAGPGSGSEAATIAAAAVTLAKIANAAANSKLVGSGASGAGAAYSEITLGTNLSMSGTTLNAATGGGGGALTLVGATVLSGDATTLAVSGLDGNTDGTYLIAGLIKTAAASNTLSALINGVATNLSLARVYNGGNDTKSSWELLGPIGNASYFQFTFTLQAKADPNSQAFHRLGNGQATASSLIINYGLYYQDTSTNITSFTMSSDQANGLANGSYLRVYKYSQS